MGNTTSGGEGSSGKGMVFSSAFGDDMGMESFDFIKPIAHGGFGEVFLVQDRRSGATYAMKVMDKAHVEKHGMVDQAKAEKAIQLQICDSPFIVNLRAAFQTDDKLAIVMDYVAGGDLFELLKVSGSFNVERARLYGAEVLCALEYLHSRSILYRDLKLENVLLDEHGHILLCDFGLAKELRAPDADASVSAASVLETVFCGTKEYMAPEMLVAKARYGFEVDCWAYGVFMYAMVTGKYPFFARTLHTLETKILNDDVWFPPSIAPDCRDLIERLLVKNPEERLTLAEAKAHPFFSELDWDRVVAKEYTPFFLPELDDAVISLRAEAASRAAVPVPAAGGDEPRVDVAGWIVNSPSSMGRAVTSDNIRERREREAASAAAAIQECRKILPDEPYIQGWVVISINKYNFNQTRVVLLTSKALYRIKHDFSSASAEAGFDHAARTPLGDIMDIQHGELHDSRFASITDAHDKPPTLYALRMVSSSENLRRTTKARTFAPFISPTGAHDTDLAAQRELTDMVVGTILAARENLLGDTEAPLVPHLVALHRETLSAVRVRELPAPRPEGVRVGHAPATRVRELATLLAEVNSQIADTEQVLAQLQAKRDAIRQELDVAAEQDGPSA